MTSGAETAEPVRERHRLCADRTHRQALQRIVSVVRARLGFREERSHHADQSGGGDAMALAHLIPELRCAEAIDQVDAAAANQGRVRRARAADVEQRQVDENGLAIAHVAVHGHARQVELQVR